MSCVQRTKNSTTSVTWYGSIATIMCQSSAKILSYFSSIRSSETELSTTTRSCKVLLPSSPPHRLFNDRREFLRFPESSKKTWFVFRGSLDARGRHLCSILWNKYLDGGLSKHVRLLFYPRLQRKWGRGAMNFKSGPIDQAECVHRRKLWMSWQ